MPNLDGTGPQGKGPLTGRRRGRCRDNQTTQVEKSENTSIEYREDVYGLGRGRRLHGGGRGRGIGCRNQGMGKGYGRR